MSQRPAEGNDKKVTRFSPEDLLAKELRKLRSLDGPLTPGKFVHTPDLAQYLAFGNETRAWQELLDIAERESDRSIEAAMTSFGYGNSADTVDARLQLIANKYYLETTRTARRWSDLGIGRLARLIASRTTYQMPELTVALEQLSTDISVHVWVDFAPSVKFLRPATPSLQLRDDYRVYLEEEIREESRVFKGGQHITFKRLLFEPVESEPGGAVFKALLVWQTRPVPVFISYTSSVPRHVWRVAFDRLSSAARITLIALGPTVESH